MLRLKTPDTGRICPVDSTDPYLISSDPTTFLKMSAVRPSLATIDQHLEDSGVKVTVSLGYGEDVYVGTADGPSDLQYRPRAVGEATLRAVENTLGGSILFDLTAVGTSDLGPVRIALVQIRQEGFSDYLIGSALIRGGDPVTATAKAVLDALNRRLVKL